MQQIKWICGQIDLFTKSFFILNPIQIQQNKWISFEFNYL